MGKPIANCQQHQKSTNALLLYFCTFIFQNFRISEFYLYAFLRSSSSYCSLCIFVAVSLFLLCVFSGWLNLKFAWRRHDAHNVNGERESAQSRDVDGERNGNGTMSTICSLNGGVVARSSSSRYPDPAFNTFLLSNNQKQ